MHSLIEYDDDDEFSNVHGLAGSAWSNVSRALGIKSEYVIGMFSQRRPNGSYTGNLGLLAANVSSLIIYVFCFNVKSVRSLSNGCGIQNILPDNV